MKFLASGFVAILGVLVFIVLVLTVQRISMQGVDPLVAEAREMAAEDAVAPELAALDRDLSRIGGTFPGEVGIAVEAVATGEGAHHDGLSLYPQQSVTKLWVAMAALAQADAVELSLDEPVTIRRRDLTVFHQPLRRIVLARGSYTGTLADMMERAITRSDNTANDQLLQRVGGPDAVEAFLEGANLGSIRFGSDERTKQSRIAGLEWRPSYSIGPAFFDARDEVPQARRRVAFEDYLADPEDGAPPVAVAAALARLARGELLSDASTALLLNTLAQTRSGPRRLKGGLPEGWSIAHKTGTGQVLDPEQSGYNDVGILTAPDGARYAVAVMIARTAAPVSDRQAMMHEVVGAVARFHDARDGG